MVGQATMPGAAPDGCAAVEPAATGAEAVYAARMAALLDRLAASLDRFADLSEAPRPSDPCWHAGLLRETGGWGELAGEVRALAVPPAAVPLHAHLLAACALLDRAGDDYARGLAALDDARIAAGITGIDAAADLIAAGIAGLAAA